MREELIQFLKEQKLVTLASIDEKGNPWISNAYYATDKDLNFYFMSKKNTNHSSHFTKKKEVAFSVAWFNPEDDEDRISIQATGTVEELKDIKYVILGAKMLYDKLKWNLEPKNLVKDLKGSAMYRIKPKYIKFWNDKLFGKPATEEYTLN